jgi:gamma-glutamylcyclotransferase (GGCT)/AIG2-like uncharacterized protein YtfP
MKKVKFLAYGSLREGEFNFDRFGSNSLTFVRNEKVKGYKMYSLGAYPFITYTGKDEDVIVCDVLETDKRIFEYINDMEVGAGYTSRLEDNLPIFVMNVKEKDLERFKQVNSGDWKLKN